MPWTNPKTSKEIAHILFMYGLIVFSQASNLGLHGEMILLKYVLSPLTVPSNLKEYPFSSNYPVQNWKWLLTA